MKAIDRNCEYLGLLPVQLMENAGAAIAQSIREKLESGKVLFIAGRGNNGGDAFVAARQLSGFSGYSVKVILLGKSQDIRTKEACHNFSLLKFSRLQMLEIKDSSQLAALALDWFSEADLLVDAIFGTGVKGNIKEPESTAVDLINREGKAGKTVTTINTDKINERHLFTFLFACFVVITGKKSSSLASAFFKFFFCCLSPAIKFPPFGNSNKRSGF